MPSLALPRDSAGFVRRVCPHCQREFKTRPFPTDGLAVQRELMRGLRHENAQETAGIALRACLYCGRLAAPEQWLTEEQRRFLGWHGEALGAQVRYLQLTHVLRTLSVNPRVTFLVLPPANPEPRVPVEPDDLRLIPLVCCGEEAKSLEGWGGSVYCPRCGTRQGDLLRDRIAPEPAGARH